MSDFAFDRACKGELDETYLAQAWCYEQATDFNPIVFIAYRKETSHIAEVIFSRDQKERVVTQRMGGHVLELAKDDPLLITEIRTPFDESVGEKVRGHFQLLGAVRTLYSMPDIIETMERKIPGVRAIEDETVSVQGLVKVESYTKANPHHELVGVAGAWSKFKTGRKIAGFPCSYCSYIKTCLGAELEIKNGKPV